MIFTYSWYTYVQQIGTGELRAVSTNLLIPQYGAKSQLEFVCIFACMFIFTTLKNVHICLGMQFYTTVLMTEEKAARAEGQ